ncbi:MAG: hypothetical protein IKS10_00520 [Lachnospiraceae bacterium]|nr:hypothetical protein [Lachnospiraceae bacterium]
MKMLKRIVCLALAAFIVMLVITSVVTDPAVAYASPSVLDGSVEEVIDGESFGLCDGKLAVIAESTSTPMTISCSRLDVSGGLLSNAGILSPAGKKYVSVDGINLYTYNIFEEVFEVAEGYAFRPGLYQTGCNIVSANDYAGESLILSAQEVRCGSLLGASEDVQINTGKIRNRTADQTTYIMAVNGNIQINTDQLDLYGLIYAPNGKVEINANRITFKGIIIANEVVIRAKCVSLKAKDIGIPIEMYSIGLEDAFTEDIMQAGYVGGSSLSSSGSSAYYYNTGGYGRDAARYDRYKLLKTVKVGDIVYEAAGFYGLTGHIAAVHKIIVHPIYIYHGESFAGSYTVRQIQVIEAVSEGVCYGILDDTRCDDMRVSVLRSNELTSSKWSLIRLFLEKQLGKPYNFDLGRKCGSINRPYWYCSELVWAAFYFAGIDIDQEKWGEPGVTPHDINNNAKLERVDYKGQSNK